MVALSETAKAFGLSVKRRPDSDSEAQRRIDRQESAAYIAAHLPPEERRELNRWLQANPRVVRPEPVLLPFPVPVPPRAA